MIKEQDKTHWPRMMYNMMYRLGTAPWDSGRTPPEVVALIEGEHALTVGRALDLGCGTGTNAIFLAQHGWNVVGVDFSSVAIQQAHKRAETIPLVTFVEGDVTELPHLGIHGPFDLVLDLGCYHSLPAARRPAYAQEVARVMRSGATFLIWTLAGTHRSFLPGTPMMQGREIAEHFARHFRLEEDPQENDGRRMPNWQTLYRW
ncbi:MAG: class I SAM-dependent methyltransferase [Ktedonobacteraceae bacterium]|nr:class I SAM-dependent methyltransferase [Ktedonobacteraceae bacterium]